MIINWFLLVYIVTMLLSVVFKLSRITLSLAFAAWMPTFQFTFGINFVHKLNSLSIYSEAPA